MSTPVKAGLDAIFTQNSRTIGFATEVSIDEDFMLEAIVTLGYHGPRGFRSLGYDSNMTVGTMILDPLNADGSQVTDNVITATRRTINTIEDFTFELIDLITSQVFLKASQCKPSNNSWSMAAAQLSNKNTQWKVREVLPVNVA